MKFTPLKLRWRRYDEDQENRFRQEYGRCKVVWLGIEIGVRPVVEDASFRGLEGMTGGNSQEGEGRRENGYFFFVTLPPPSPFLLCALLLRFAFMFLLCELCFCTLLRV